MLSTRTKSGTGEVRECARFVDPKTCVITKRAFGALLSEGGVDGSRRVIEYFQTERTQFSASESVLCCKASDKLKQCIILMGKVRREASIAFNVQDFRERNWDIHHGNIYREFTALVASAFDDGVFHFGRFITFFAVAVSFAVYVFTRGMEDAVESVHAWTDQAIETTLSQLFLEKGGWEGFVDYADRLLEKLKKDIQKLEGAGSDNSPSTVTVSLATVGVIGAAVAAVFAVKSILS